MIRRNRRCLSTISFIMSSATISAFTAVALGSLPAVKALMVAEGADG
jgi:hypothetical protein